MFSKLAVCKIRRFGTKIQCAVCAAQILGVWIGDGGWVGSSMSRGWGLECVVCEGQILLFELLPVKMDVKVRGS